MLRAIIEDATELAGLALFLAALALILSPEPALAADGISSPGACIAWIVPSVAGGIVAGGIACALIYMRNAVRAFGDDVSDHDNNDIHAAERAESIRGEP